MISKHTLPSLRRGPLMPDLLNPTLLLLLGLGGLSVAVIWALLRASKAADQESQARMDQLVTQIVAQRLADRLQLPVERVMADLFGEAPEPSLVERYHEQIDEVTVRLIRQGARVTLSLRIRGEAAFEKASSLTFDDLPTSARQAMMRGEDTLEFPWTPAFDQRG